MAWIDDRIWCHSKIVPLSDAAFRVHFNAIAYSAGMGLGGRLEQAHQKLMGATAKTRAELVDAGLWDADGSAILIHDWDAHNGLRDERRRKDRERKKSSRASAGTSAGQSAGQSAGRSTGTAHVEGSEGSERMKNGMPLTEEDVLPVEIQRQILKALTFIGADADESTPVILRHYCAQLPEGLIAKCLESAQQKVGRGQTIDNRAAYIVGALQSEVMERNAA